jgi:hypothetical protein
MVVRILVGNVYYGGMNFLLDKQVYCGVLGFDFYPLSVFVF